MHQGQCGCRTLELCLHYTPAAAKINIADKVPAAYRLIIDGDEVARVSSGPTKMTTAAGTLGYTFIWSVRLMSRASPSTSPRASRRSPGRARC